MKKLISVIAVCVISTISVVGACVSDQPGELVIDSVTALPDRGCGMYDYFKDYGYYGSCKDPDSNRLIINRPRYRSKYENVDGSYNWYYVDVIKPNGYTIVRDRQYRKLLVENSVLESVLDKDVEEIVAMPGVYLLSNTIYRGNDMMLPFEEDYQFYRLGLPEMGEGNRMYSIDFNGTRKYRKLSEKYWEVRFFRHDITGEYEPESYVMVLITGAGFNAITYDPFIYDEEDNRIRFKDENQYYKMVIPMTIVDNYDIWKRNKKW